MLPGSYYLQFAARPGTLFSPRDQGSDDNVDSDPNSTGLTDLFSLAVGDVRDDIDAGLIAAEQYNCMIGDKVWTDHDADGILDFGEVGRPGVTVQLLSATGSVEAETTTDNTGHYWFLNVPPGSYRIQFILAPRKTFTLRDQGSDDAIDSDADSDGLTPLFTLVPGQTDWNFDAGVNPGRLGGFAWNDTNGNGIRDAGETGRSPVPVFLFDPETQEVVASTVTRADGYYEFSEINAGSYKIQFMKPFGCRFSDANQGSDDTLDSDVTDPITGMTNTFSFDGRIKLDVCAGLIEGGGFSPMFAD